MNALHGFLDTSGGGIAAVIVVVFLLWKLLPLFAAVGRGLIQGAIGLCFALLGIGFIGFVGFGLVRTIFYPLFR